MEERRLKTGLRRMLLRAAWFLVCAVALFVARAEAQPSVLAEADFFEAQVRPLLVERCLECHGDKKQEDGLRLDSRAGWQIGGDRGPAVVPGRPEASLLIQAVRYADDTLQMPPDRKLNDREIAVLTEWVRRGAYDPRSATQVRSPAEAAKNHWAFQPVVDPPVPSAAGGPAANPIDDFWRSQLAKNQLTASPPADRRTLIRRLAYDLTGLPPSAAEVEAFASDRDPNAYERLVDRLLASPHYGEQWARHWLDIARYSDTKGYVYAREQRKWVHAWVYRDWVVRALNDDMPYDRFLLLQIAGDELTGGVGSSGFGSADLAAMGFLTLGRRFLGVQRDIIDDRIDVLTRGTMGLTVSCARCHDHKYDPIPTKDYYSLYGVLQSSVERLVPIESEERANGDPAFTKELASRRKKLAETLAARRSETSARVRSRAGDYLAAQLELQKYPPEGFDQILAKTDLLPTFVRRWEVYLNAAAKRHDPVFIAWHAFAEIPAGKFATQSVVITKSLAERRPNEINALVAKKFTAPPKSMAEVAARYGELFAQVEQQWQAAAKSQAPPPERLADPHAEALRQVLYDRTGPCEVPDEPIVNIEYYFDSASCTELWKLQNEVDNWLLQSPSAPKHAAILTDRDPPATPRVFRRGNPAQPGDEVPRQFLEVIAGANRRPFAHGSGRRELAQAIVDPKNPLTARVIVNRVWQHHMGAGLVRTPSDFGTRAEPPSHPELLDWLTSRFIADGWSLKKLHRRILLSGAYRQSSFGPDDSAHLARARQIDPENRLLWRLNPRRLSFEELRDSLLAAAGRIDRAVGGRPGDLFSADFRRRSLYGSIDRQFFPTALRVFDFANPDLHIPQRSDTTVPQQALFLMNHPLVIEYAEAVADRTDGAAGDPERIRGLYAATLQRLPSNDEMNAALQFLATARRDVTNEAPRTVADWQYGYGRYDSASERLVDFEKLPYFNGTAWQGSSTYPDGRLGWAQLTAEGGHPGNDLAHAVVRRWTAPVDLTVAIASQLTHEPTQGKGVRGFVVASRQGLLASAGVHHDKADLRIDSVDVKAGDTIDFVVDRGSLLSHNQFRWTTTIIGPTGKWDSRRDFAAQATRQLDPWEQLAQVLLTSNEFAFID